MQCARMDKSNVAAAAAVAALCLLVFCVHYNKVMALIVFW